MTDQSDPPAVPRPATRPAVGAAAALVFVAAAVFGVAQWRGFQRDAETPVVQAAPTQVPPEAPAARARRELGEMNYAEAMAWLRTGLADPDPGRKGRALLELMVWAEQRLRWPDVAIEETTLPEAAKDIDAALGKRVCASGTLLNIHKDAELPGAPFVGALTPGGGWTSLGFIAYGSTGKLVEGSPARFCGIVANNAAQTIQAVGLFDLPQNRPLAPANSAAKPTAIPRSAADRKLMGEMMGGGKDPSTISADDVAAAQRRMSEQQAPPRDEKKAAAPPP